MPRRLTRQEALERVRGDLAQVLGRRLQSLVVYATPHADRLHTLAVVQEFTADDLMALARAGAGWGRAGIAVPLLFDRAELRRSLDAFPLEFSQILAHYEVVAGEDLLAGLSVRGDDLRRACEAQARSHLVHLREGYLQAGGEPAAVAELVGASLEPLRALLANIARLHGAQPATPEALAAFVTERLHLPAAALRPLLALPPAATPSPSDAEHLFPGYLDSVARLANLVDEWQV
ncbi:MAG TPA: hypothetical protein VK911_03375 [Vicinamibacterales bacterium]|nr:hypothetical protein [Vicinamibacterales bacterium]